MSKWRWWAAALLFIVVVVVGEMELPNGQQIIHRIVYSSEDLIVVRTMLQRVFLQQEQIPASTKSMDNVSSFTSIERYKEGVFVTYEQPIGLQAFFDGLVIFTGYTKSTGKTVTILYDEGTTVTYGFLDDLVLLPYTSLQAGELIVQQQGSFYMQLDQNGVALSMEEIVAWLKET